MTMSPHQKLDKYICGKHKKSFDNALSFNLHIIDDHDGEHGIWQQAGSTKWSKEDLKTGMTVPYYGRFRYLPMYWERNCEGLK